MHGVENVHVLKLHLETELRSDFLLFSPAISLKPSLAAETSTSMTIVKISSMMV